MTPTTPYVQETQAPVNNPVEQSVASNQAVTINTPPEQVPAAIIPEPPESAEVTTTEPPTQARRYPSRSKQRTSRASWLCSIEHCYEH